MIGNELQIIQKNYTVMKEGIANVTYEQTNFKKEKFNKTILMNSILYHIPILIMNNFDETNKV
jgi:hypothetical protein